MDGRDGQHSGRRRAGTVLGLQRQRLDAMIPSEHGRVTGVIPPRLGSLGDLRLRQLAHDLHYERRHAVRHRRPADVLGDV